MQDITSQLTEKASTSGHQRETIKGKPLEGIKHLMKVHGQSLVNKSVLEQLLNKSWTQRDVVLCNLSTQEVEA
jgi:hypothetical protein